MRKRIRRAGVWLRAVFVATAIWAALPFVKLPRLVRWLEAGRRSAVMDEEERRMRIDAARRVALYPYFLVRNNCLKKSLLLYETMLRSGETGVALHVGVYKSGDKLDGHAWLTKDGSVFLDSEPFVNKFKVIYTSGVTYDER